MAPTIFGQISYSKEHLTSTHKLRKPMVEKLRRDRINTSIEQLKSLLGPEFLRQHPDSKQEKADILEMAVYFLSRWQQQQQRVGTFSSSSSSSSSSTPTPASEGYTRCVQEALSFLSHSQAKTQTQMRLLGHFQSLRPSATNTPGQASPKPPLSPPGSPANHPQKGVSPINIALWRPW